MAINNNDINQVLTVSRIKTYGWIAIGLFFLIGIGWGVFAQLEGAVISGGKVSLESGRYAIQHKYGGEVEAIDISNYDYVEKGELLLSFDGVEIAAQIAVTRQKYYQNLAQIARLKAEANSQESIEFSSVLTDEQAENSEVANLISGQEALFISRQNRYKNQLSGLSERINQLEVLSLSVDQQLVNLQEQIAINRQELERQEGLFAKKLTTSGEITAVRNTQAQLADYLISAQSRLAELESQKIQAEAERDALINSHDAEIYEALRQNELERSTNLESLLSLEDQANRLNIYAPVDGYVYDLKIETAGTVVRAAEQIMDIVPKDAELTIISQVQPRDIEEVYVGQEAKISFSALENGSLDKLRGEVKNISADAIIDERSGLQFYNIETVILDGETAKLGDNILRPGMPAEVYLITEYQTPLSYLTEPIRRYLDQAMR